MHRDAIERMALAAITILTIAATMLVIVEVALPVSAQAQESKGPVQAPIGHRQPRAQDLPPDVLRSEGMSQPSPGSGSQTPALPPEGSDNAGNAQRRSKLNQNLQICRGC